MWKLLGQLAKFQYHVKSKKIPLKQNIKTTKYKISTNDCGK